MNPPNEAPAPWTLTGQGYVLLYKFPADFSTEHSIYGPYQGGLGAVMLVDYATSNVGPYYELLLIPGRVELPGKTGYSISQIVVSTEASVTNGRANWGIPKYQADFEWRTEGNSDHIRVSRDHEAVVTAELNEFGPSFPVTAAILPPVVQRWEGRTFITRLKSSGWGRLARVKSLNVNAAQFPPFDRFRPLVAVKVTEFTLTFPVPEVMHGS